MITHYEPLWRWIMKTYVEIKERYESSKACTYNCGTLWIRVAPNFPSISIRRLRFGGYHNLQAVKRAVLSGASTVRQHCWQLFSEEYIFIQEFDGKCWTAVNEIFLFEKRYGFLWTRVRWSLMKWLPPTDGTAYIRNEVHTSYCLFNFKSVHDLRLLLPLYCVRCRCRAGRIYSLWFLFASQKEANWQKWDGCSGS